MLFANYVKEMQNLYEEQNTFVTLADPLVEQELAMLEKTFGQPLPAGLRAAWRQTNGVDDSAIFFARPGSLTGYTFLSAQQALQERDRMQKRAAQYADYTEPEERDSRIQAGWFQPGWLPFGLLPGGSLLLLVDMSPATNGRSGQIIGFQHDPDQIEFLAESWSSFLDASLEAIAADPEEFLQEY